MSKTDDELIEAIRELDTALMSPMYVFRMANAMATVDQLGPGSSPSGTATYTEAQVRGAKTRMANAARKIDGILREWMCDHGA